MFKRFWRKQEPARVSDRQAQAYVLGKPVHDLRDDWERQVEADAVSGKSLGREVDALVAELIGIARAGGFYSPSDTSGKYRENGTHIRARQIGELLNKRGGVRLMTAVSIRVRMAVPREGRPLDKAWDRVGEWMY